MKKILVFVALFCAFFYLSAFALELQGLTVDGNYWFGAGKGFVLDWEDPVKDKQNSMNFAASASFAPGFIMSLDYTYGTRSQMADLDDGELLEAPDYIDSASHQLIAANVGYSAMLVPKLYATASIGFGSYEYKSKTDYSGADPYWNSVRVKALRPQIGLAAQYQVTPDFSLRGNVATFLGNDGEISIDASNGWSSSIELDLKLLRWQIEGKYLLKAGWEAVAGYRVWDIHTIWVNPEDERDEFDLDSSGFYLGARYSY